MMPLDTNDDINDDALMVLFANGDGQAASVLAYRHTGRVLALALRMLGDQAEAEDVAQEALMRLWKIAPDWRQGEAKVSTWLYRVASNLCTDRLRKHAGKRATEDIDNVPEPKDDTPSIEADLIARDRADALQAALRTLPTRQRKAVSLRFLQELANPEVAEIMEISVEAVESLLSRGKRGLAQALEAQRMELGLDT
ncbi:RNA polymerase sigma factor [Neptunicoccus cionae]|uniref:RNA polymerase sigma subunit ECF family protein n=1 Tax=Neptunicoccus cionae TaxID=2035344 RepID=A0A916QRQ7_9RHOB|nr:RNA polymerase sigma factor [Amylibacter cionae]GGA08686.1 RNA polymerase sigma subunit ECF family protein [Amylibacter cionae]